MSKITPGPWTLGNGEVRIRTEKNELGRSTLIAECYTTNNAGRYPKLEERKANARLIAAAPELIAALKFAVSELYSIHSKYGDKEHAKDSCFAIRFGEEIIAKAEAES